MRTTIRLEDPLLRRAKARAAERGISLNDFITDAVRAALQRRSEGSAPVPLPTLPGGILLPGIDLDDTASLLDVMEGRTSYSAVRVHTGRVAEQPTPGPTLPKTKRKR